MSRIYSSALELIGRTPLVQLQNIEKSQGCVARLLVKLESFNPGGSAKDRIALSMILDAESKGLLQPGGAVIEPTSGNTGIGLSMVCACRGYRAIIVMPDTMSVERQKLMKAYGAEVVLTPGTLGMQGAIEKAQNLQKEIPGSIIAGQFDNPANPQGHRATTGPEIWEDTQGEVDIFVVGVGTGGTLTGVGQYLKSKRSDVQIVAVEPERSPLLSGGAAGSHGLQGIGANFVPAVLDRAIYDQVLTCTEEDAYAAARLLANREGILAGISSGAALHCGISLAKSPENTGKTVVVLLPDTGERYLSTDLF